MKSIAVSGNFLKTAVVFQPAVLWTFGAGVLFSLGFSPYNFAGLTILSLSFFYTRLLHSSLKEAVFYGFIYGLGMFGFGVSWIIISIHDYGLLNYFSSGCITLVFLFYLSCYVALTGLLFKILAPEKKPLLSALSFAALWTILEYARSIVMTGFPWLLAGVSQLHSPLKFLAPLVGSYGLSFMVCLAAAFLANSLKASGKLRVAYIVAFTIFIIFPKALQSVKWTTIANKPISIGVIQSNLSMRDKWDEKLFWQLLNHYQTETDKLLGKDVIIMPESAIPLPSSYLEPYLTAMNNKALAAHSAIIFGILESINDEEVEYNNALMTLGNAQGRYLKRHLVPFGEYIPHLFKSFFQWLMLPESKVVPGKAHQELIRIGKSPVATLICYDIAYPELLRQQLPAAQWIISLSDNGWFGHSLASYQQLQMAQMLSLQTGRYQILANNDGLSSVIGANGDLLAHLPPFSSGILQSEIFSAQGSTPWVRWGDKPLILLCGLLILVIFLSRKVKPLRFLSKAHWQ